MNTSFKRHACLILLTLTLCRFAFAQQDTDVAAVPQTNGSLRDQYIKGYPDDFFIWPVLKQRKLDFDMRMMAGDKPELAFRSNRPYSLGVGLYLFELAAEIALAIPLDEQNQKIYGESKARDLHLNIIGRRWGIDAYHQRYKGFYINDSETQVPANTPYPQRGDVRTRNTGVTINYTFNHRRFSFRSAYNFSERQLRSAGSPLFFASLRQFAVSGDSAIVGDRPRDAFADVSQISKVTVTHLGIAPGYTYSLIYRGFFLNGALGIGPGHNWIGYREENGYFGSRNNFSTMIAARLALGFNGDRIFGGFSFMNQGGTARFNGLEMNAVNSSFKILAGYRFREKGILKKRVWDLPAALF